MLKQAMIVVVATSVVVGLGGCGGGGGGTFVTQSALTRSTDGAIAASWFELIYDRIRSQGYSPPVAARLYGYLGITAYEALVHGMPGHNSLVGQLNGLNSLPVPDQSLRYDWPTVANTALEGVASTLFLSQTQATIDAFVNLEAQWNLIRSFEVPADAFDRSVVLGQDLAIAINAWAAGDDFTTFNNCMYTAPVGPGLWEPTPPAMAAPLQPCWGSIRTFALTSGAACPPPAPLAYSTDPASAFYAEALEVYNVGLNLSQEQADIADFWADGPGATGTPAGHWVRLVSTRLTEEQRDLEFAAEAFARVGIAVHDAFVNCWACKYAYNVLRPITYVRAQIDAAWSPYIGTPPFPEYTSGHSSQSGAASAVLADLWGNGPFVDSSKVSLGFPTRSFVSWDAAADEAAISRLYGGIHYRSGNVEGLAAGRCVAAAILQRVQFRN